MKIACIGGGPAGLYLGILVKRAAPAHEVVVYERNRPSDTFGFGVVFSDATLGNLAAADPETHAEIAGHFARWDDIEVHVGGEVLRSTGHGFCGIERKLLLQILQTRAQDLGVAIEFQREITALDQIEADVIVACDGAASWVRAALADELAPRVDVRPNKFVWLGCTVPYDAFTFLFKETPHGMFRVHAYPFHAEGSTFIVECREEVWRAAGLDRTDEDGTVEILERLFADELRGHHLVKNRSIWRNFPTVRCGAWSAGNVVLLGDAAHTAHFSIGSGTKLAMEDAIALRDELLAAETDIPAALRAYEAKRRPDVEALQAAAQASLEWFEGTERYRAMTPVQFTYSLMTRTLRVSHASMGKRDPHLARGVEMLIAATVGAEVATRPSALPVALGSRQAPSRIAMAEGAPGAVTAGLVVAHLPIDVAPGAAAGVAKVAGEAHGRGALAAARIDASVPAEILAKLAREAQTAGFDLLVLDAGASDAAIEALPANLAAARAAWGAHWIAAVVRDQPLARAAVIGRAAQLARAGADLLWVVPAHDAARAPEERLPAATLADRLRNELGVAVAIETRGASLPHLDAAIAAGRADLVVVDRMPEMYS